MKGRTLIIFVILTISTIYLYRHYIPFKEKTDKILVQLGIKKAKKEMPEMVTLTEPEPVGPVKKKARERIPKKLLPDPFSKLDAYARNVPEKHAKHISSLAGYLVKPAKNETEKARLLYTWIASHIRYDADGYNTGIHGDYSANGVLDSRKAVCEGYSNLFLELGKEMGLEVVKISGYSKGYSFRPGKHFTKTDHAWNAVKIDGKWKLSDATWGSGFGVNKNGKLVSISEFDPYWFNVDPKEFIFTHLPENDEWQLTGNIITISQYEQLPSIEGHLFKLSINTNEFYEKAINGSLKDVVSTFAIEFPFKSSAIPYEKSLLKGTSYTFVFETIYAEEIALIEGNEWFYFEKEGDTFTLTHTPSKKNLNISMKVNWYDKSFSGIARYNVKTETALSSKL